MDNNHGSHNEIEVVYADSDQDGKEEIEDVDEVERKHLEVLAEAKTLTAGKVSQFQDLVKLRWHDGIDRRTDDNRTFLHVVAADVSSTPHIRWLVASVLAHPLGVKQMGEVDDEKKTPLYTAITSSNKHFLTAATGRPSSETTIKRVGDALAIEAARYGETTSLHAAITNQRKISTDLLLRIIQLAPKKIFSVQDAGGHTPLHLAVEYPRCLPQQLTVVRELISRDQSVLERTTRDGYSVYQFHVNSRRSLSAVKTTSKQVIPMTNGPLSHMTPNNRSEKQVVSPGIATLRSNPATTKGYEHELIAEQEQPPPQRRPSLVIDTQIESPDPLTTDTPVEPQPSVGGNTTTNNAEAGRLPSKTVEVSADEVRDELKLQSLRVMPCDVALRCLHISCEIEKEMWFDYVPGPQAPMTFKEFETHWAKLDFDSTLQYVALPNVYFRLGDDDDQPAERVRDDATRIFKWLGGRGVRRILRVIVLEAAKPDSGPGYHSNEAIAGALRSLQVEILDWRRPDICSATIVQIGENLRELCLQWSGNNAILRSWCELQGLPMLSRYGKLEFVRIAVTEDGPDIGPSTKKNLHDFTERFKLNWTTMAELFNEVWENAKVGAEPAAGQGAAMPNGKSDEDLAGKSPKSTRGAAKMKLLERLLKRLTEGNTLTDRSFDEAQGESEKGTEKPSEKPSGGAAEKALPKPPRIKVEDSSGGHRFTSYEPDDGGGQTPHKSHLDQHRWIQIMEDFSSALLRVPQPEADEIHKNPTLAPIKIALIDDGVDTTNPSLQGSKYLGKSFDFYEGGRRNHSYWISQSGHGTIMAKFVRSICPTAEIYVIKLATDLARGDPNRLTIDVESAINAIYQAVYQKARIILMSWSVSVPNKGDERDRFDMAIQQAIRDGIVMFCAASDQGTTGDKTYPYASNPGAIFRIGAATDTGVPTDYAGDTKELNFTFPGHEVLLKDDTPDKHLGEVQTGSSIATALAASLAAVVLECARLGHLRTTRTSQEARERMSFPITGEDVVKMDAAAVQDAFVKMSKSRTSYIWVWESFTAEINERIKDGTDDEKLEIIASLAWKFLGK